MEQVDMTGEGMTAPPKKTAEEKVRELLDDAGISDLDAAAVLDGLTEMAVIVQPAVDAVMKEITAQGGVVIIESGTAALLLFCLAIQDKMEKKVEFAKEKLRDWSVRD